MSEIQSKATYRTMPDWMFDARVPGEALKLIGILMSMSYRTGECFPSIGLLVELSGISESSVRRNLKELVALGMIEVRHRTDAGGARQTTNLYVLWNESYSPWSDEATVLREGVKSGGGCQIWEGEGVKSTRGEGVKSDTPLKDTEEGRNNNLKREANASQKVREKEGKSNLVFSEGKVDWPLVRAKDGNFRMPLAFSHEGKIKDLFLEWVGQRLAKTAKHQPTVRALELSVKWWGEYPEDAICAALERSIAGSYDGLFEDEAVKWCRNSLAKQAIQQNAGSTSDSMFGGPGLAEYARQTFGG